MADEEPRLFLGDLLGNYVCRSIDAYEVADKVLAALGDNGYVVERLPIDDDDWAAAGLEFLAELEREFGPIPEEIRAEVRRKWHG
jgi:hypothetical protein